MYAEIATVYGKNKSSIHEIVKEANETHASLAATTQTTEVITTVRDKFLVKMEKALNLYDKIFWERPHSHNFYYNMLL